MKTELSNCYIVKLLKRHITCHVSHITSKKGFTLLEILVVIAIIALMLAIALPNYVSARARARDSKKIQEMLQVKTALRLYYNDYGTYPLASSGAIKYLSSIRGCGPSGTSTCPYSGCTSDFSAGGADGCQTLYMKKFPVYAAAYPVYYYYVSATDYRLVIKLENASDASLATSQSLCPSAGGASCTNLNYCVCAD